MHGPGRRYPSRVSEACSGVSDPYTTDEGIEDECLCLFQNIRFDMAKKKLWSVSEK